MRVKEGYGRSGARIVRQQLEVDSNKMRVLVGNKGKGGKEPNL